MLLQSVSMEDVGMDLVTPTTTINRGSITAGISSLTVYRFSTTVPHFLAEEASRSTPVLLPQPLYLYVTTATAPDMERGRC